MKYSVIKDIFYCNRGNHDNIELSDEYKKASVKFIDMYREFLKVLTDEQKATFEKLLSLKDDMEAECAEQYYKEGFKVGLLLGVESSIT